jgi:hypothetical protein
MAGYAYSDEYDDIEDDRYDLGASDEDEADDERIEELEALLRAKQSKERAALALVPDIDEDLCSNCGEKPPRSGKDSRCETCYKYEKRTGKPRPVKLIERARTPRLRDDPATAAYIYRMAAQMVDDEDRYVGGDERRRDVAEIRVPQEWRRYVIYGTLTGYARETKQVEAANAEISDTIQLGEPVTKSKQPKTLGIKISKAMRKEATKTYDLPPEELRNAMRTQQEALWEAIRRAAVKIRVERKRTREQGV